MSRALAPVGRFFTRLADSIPGPRWVGWITLAVVVLGLAALLARRSLRRRVAGPSQREAVLRQQREDARALERRAAEAEAAGDWDTAVRTRFRAGLLRLAEDRVVENRPSLLTEEVRRRLRSEDFDGLARGFEEVAYGGRPAQAQDAAEARERWSRVLAEAHA